jgi:uncharacterized protein YeeX (DUF496 family)
MKFTLLFVMLAFPAFNLLAQDNNKADEQSAYEKTIRSRAEKIVATLNISDSIKANRVIGLIAGQYRNLNEIYTDRDLKIKEAKAASQEKEALTANIRNIEDAATAQVLKLHGNYISQLSRELTPEQVVKVKDGMTYNVLPITYKAFLDMIPSLKQNEKDQIMAWLVEAREYAMDGESSEKKHWWFGKYKGRINNYLSAAGYDLKKEREDWQKRIKEEEEKKKRTQN